MHDSVCSCGHIVSNFEYNTYAQALMEAFQWNLACLECTLPDLTLIWCLNLPAPFWKKKNAKKHFPWEPLHLKCRVDGVYMASDWLRRSLSMFSRNRTRVTALQEQCNMADVGSQKCLHGNTPACALGLYGSRLDAARRLTLLRYKHREMFEQSSKFKGNCSLLSPWASMGACTEY